MNKDKGTMIAGPTWIEQRHGRRREADVPTEVDSAGSAGGLLMSNYNFQVPVDVSNGNRQPIAQVNAMDPYFMLIGSQELMAARPAENKKFQVDPYTYKEWRLQFDTYVDSMQGISHKRKFTELLHWVTGPAYKAIKSCKMILDPLTAYRLALQKLEETRGMHEAASTE